MRKPLTSAFVLSALLGVAACKQGLNARCQTNDDCEGGLRCGMQGTCYNPAIAIVDASTDLGDARIVADSRFMPDGSASDARAADGPLVADGPLADAPAAAPDAAELLADAPDQTPDAPGAGKPARGR